jgi:uncharacterized membrane protein required for colicin V production
MQLFRRADDESAEPSVWSQPVLRNLLIGVGAGGIVATALVWLTMGWVPGIIVGLLALGVWQGLFRGAAEIIGLAVGLVLAMLLAPPLGRLFEGIISTVIGTQGLTNRFVSILAVGVVVVIVSWFAGSMFATRIVKRRPEWFTLNRYVGGGLGALEGLLLALCIIWIPTAVRPVAAVRSAAEADERIYDAMVQGTYKLGDQAPPATKTSLADWLLARAEDIDNSTLGSAVNAANPLSTTQILNVAEDYLAVLRDEDATEMLQNSDVWKRMLALPSVSQARGVVEQDESLRQIFETEGFNISALRALLDSPTVLKVMDETDIRAELEPLAPELINAIKQARESIKPMVELTPRTGG